MHIICFDPGDHTGWVKYDSESKDIIGGTLLRDNMYKPLDALLFKSKTNPVDLIIFETFNLYPGLAKHLSWNSFYPVEVIGILKFLAYLHEIPIIGQAPSIKKFAGTIIPQELETLKRYSGEDMYGKCTEHTKDALLHLMYYRRNNHT